MLGLYADNDMLAVSTEFVAWECMLGNRNMLQRCHGSSAVLAAVFLFSLLVCFAAVALS